MLGVTNESHVISYAHAMIKHQARHTTPPYLHIAFR